MKNLTQCDTEARTRALDPDQSFIVQAPAGSGKTELLVRRYLLLLARVHFPEAIIAITFTRKAAHEMRMRILDALEKAAQHCPTSTKEQVRWQLARNAIAQDKAMNWNLLANPNRLRIQTIDSFCQRLTRQMPLLSKLDAQLSPADNPKFLYRLAAQELITSLEMDSSWQHALLALSKHVDNDLSSLEELLSALLASREQWLSYFTQDPTHLREPLEKTLQTINQALIASLNSLISGDLLQELNELLNFSLHQREEKPLDKIANRYYWQQACFLLLRDDNEWRKEVAKKQGFPPPSSEKDKQKKACYTAIKQRVVSLIEQLQSQAGVHDALIAFRSAPPLHYTDAQWGIITALFDVLPMLVAHLKVFFQHTNKVDHTEILLCALAALGDEENPSDLALSLDYQIEHLLIDEFQDTSVTQFQLIEKLTAGWQTNEGKTLFLVGDPMQSIYRFRKAEVGLFLQAKQNGIGNIPLQSLTLSVNFRSNPDIVTWINDCFSQILPKEENINQGAITFAPAIASQSQSNEKAVGMYWMNNKDALLEANQVIAIIQEIQQKNPQDSIAILVRARTHLESLLPALQAAKLAYHTVDIETLGQHSAVQDMVALTRALLHLGDRISWLALLRSPFCGLDLSDLHAIAHFCGDASPAHTIWQQLTEFEKIDLSEESKQRCRRIVPILQQCFAEQTFSALSSWIKNTWIRLGGPTTLHNPEEITHIQHYLDHLEKKVLTEADALDLFTLEKELADIGIENNKTLSNPIEIMTIHKAKGLEYDHIILPSLDHKSGNDKTKLMLYQERHLTQTKKDRLLAPIKAKSEKEDLIYNYLSRTEKQKTRYELTRLLYVASTRAKKSLSLLGFCEATANEEIKKPPSDSLLHPLWQAMTIHRKDFFSSDMEAQATNKLSSSRLKRLPADWQNPIFTPKIVDNIAYKPFAYQWQPHLAKLTGTVIHRLLYQISQDGLEYWDKIDFSQEHTRFVRLLEQAGIISSQLDEALYKLKQALKKIIQDPRGRWILSQQHQDAHSEFALSVAQDNNLQQLIMDRTFVDAGIRWIIDYKTTAYTGNSPDMFLNTAMQQHQKQLENYAAAFSRLSPLKEHYKICLGLYFPLDTLWQEWEYLPSPRLMMATDD
ncbi:UvrD-helicase domain-containing protein [Rickettsiella endosymbiont of Dermanyssus gallinae]|uniref:UvrD-helicase domain-containing protein n=1 Tax=Rickettsiella endosymbiont of Dermanyssus gallinae TaxID=2856608 RepID=UPI001C52CFAB|nr:UvrD-helicase domain-containing protein [Rickettsiella endosymbiont of Dermanyssus gallinae]